MVTTTSPPIEKSHFVDRLGPCSEEKPQVAAYNLGRNLQVAASPKHASVSDLAEMITHPRGSFSDLALC